MKSAYEEANIQTWTQEELDAYEYAFMREEDERARLDKAVEKGMHDAKRDAVLGLDNNDIPIPIIAISLKLTESEVIQIIEQWKNK